MGSGTKPDDEAVADRETLTAAEARRLREVIGRSLEGLIRASEGSNVGLFNTAALAAGLEAGSVDVRLMRGYLRLRLNCGQAFRLPVAARATLRGLIRSREHLVRLGADSRVGEMTWLQAAIGVPVDRRAGDEIVKFIEFIEFIAAKTGEAAVLTEMRADDQVTDLDDVRAENARLTAKLEALREELRTLTTVTMPAAVEAASRAAHERGELSMRHRAAEDVKDFLTHNQGFAAEGIPSEAAGRIATLPLSAEIESRSLKPLKASKGETEHKAFARGAGAMKAAVLIALYELPAGTWGDERGECSPWPEAIDTVKALPLPKDDGAV